MPFESLPPDETPRRGPPLALWALIAAVAMMAIAAWLPWRVGEIRTYSSALEPTIIAAMFGAFVVQALVCRRISIAIGGFGTQIAAYYAVCLLRLFVVIEDERVAALGSHVRHAPIRLDDGYYVTAAATLIALIACVRLIADDGWRWR